MTESLSLIVAAASGLYLLSALGIVQFMRLVRNRDRELRTLTAAWIAGQERTTG